MTHLAVLLMVGYWFFLFDAEQARVIRIPEAGLFSSWVECEETAAWIFRRDPARFWPSICREEVRP